MRIVPATLDDLRAIDDLRRKDQESVGFVPMSCYEAEINRGRQTLLVLTESGETVGYLYWTRGFPVASIQQVVVRQDARRRERATALVDAAVAAMKAQGRVGVTCRCRVNIEGIEFWRSLGWREVRLEQSGRRGPLLRFYRELSPPLFEIGVRAAGIPPGHRKGFRRLAMEAES